MRLPFRNFRAVVAAGVSLWRAVLACLMGCTLPMFANSGANSGTSSAASADVSDASLVRQNSAAQNEPDMMANMPNCPHHSGGNAPAKPHDQKPARGGGMSCCPVEVTVASKPHPVALHIAPATDFAPAQDFTLATIRIFHAVQFVPPVWHSGRDTLLETQLLRI
jgi:hypothetical protein